MSNVKKYFLLALGILLSAYPVISILQPNGLMTGGITGLSRLIETAIVKNQVVSPFLDKYLLSIVYYILAIIVLILAYLFLGKKEAVKIFFLSLVYPIALFLFTFLNLPPIIINEPISAAGNTVATYHNLIIPAIMHGAISGIGVGLMLRSGYTSGGSDTIAKIIWKRLLPFVNYSNVLLLVDGIIIVSSLFVFDLGIVFYALLTKYINMKTIDIIVLGIGNRRVKMEIISSKPEEIMNFIHNSIHRGVTIVDTEGAYSKIKMKQIITICSPKESLFIKRYIAEIDQNAFVYVIPSSTVWGRGFKDIRNDEI